MTHPNPKKTSIRVKSYKEDLNNERIYSCTENIVRRKLSLESPVKFKSDFKFLKSLIKQINQSFRLKYLSQINTYEYIQIEAIYQHKTTSLVAGLRENWLLNFNFEFLIDYFRKSESWFFLTKYIRNHSESVRVFPNYSKLEIHKILNRNINKKQQLINELYLQEMQNIPVKDSKDVHAMNNNMFTSRVIEEIMDKSQQNLNGSFCEVNEIIKYISTVEASSKPLTNKKLVNKQASDLTLVRNLSNWMKTKTLSSALKKNFIKLLREYFYDLKSFLTRFRDKHPKSLSFSFNSRQVFSDELMRKLVSENRNEMRKKRLTKGGKLAVRFFSLSIIKKLKLNIFPKDFIIEQQLKIINDAKIRRGLIERNPNELDKPVYRRTEVRVSPVFEKRYLRYKINSQMDIFKAEHLKTFADDQTLETTRRDYNKHLYRTIFSRTERSETHERTKAKDYGVLGSYLNPKRINKSFFNQKASSESKHKGVKLTLSTTRQKSTESQIKPRINIQKKNPCMIKTHKSKFLNTITSRPTKPEKPKVKKKGVLFPFLVKP